MLPFLKQKPVAGLIVAHRKPDGHVQESHTEGQEDDGLHACAEEMMRATKAGDAKAYADALRSAFQILDSEPHEEGPHTNDVDSMNEKAAKESR